MFVAEPAHGRGFLAGEVGVGVEVVDLVADGVVFVGDGAVGDPGIDEGHPQGAVAEQGGDRLDPHAAVDGLGGQGVAELVRVDVAEAGRVGRSGSGSG